jgi:hypothetical protein
MLSNDRIANMFWTAKRSRGCCAHDAFLSSFHTAAELLFSADLLHSSSDNPVPASEESEQGKSDVRKPCEKCLQKISTVLCPPIAPFAGRSGAPSSRVLPRSRAALSKQVTINKSLGKEYSGLSLGRLATSTVIGFSSPSQWIDSSPRVYMLFMNAPTPCRTIESPAQAARSHALPVQQFLRGDDLGLVIPRLPLLFAPKVPDELSQLLRCKLV